MKSTKTLDKWILKAVLWTAITATSPLFAQGTGFTYQGRLADNGTFPTATSYDMRFTLYDSPSGPNVIAGPLVKSGVSVAGGLFTASLDFGAVFTGPDRWLKIEISPAGQNTYTALSARQQLTPSPYAIFAGSISNAAVSASQLNTPAPPANGQFLEYTGGSLTWVAAPSGGFTLPYNSGAISSSSSLFTLNNTGSGAAASFLGNVGVGTTTPASQLEVANSDSKVALNIGVPGVLPGGTIGLSRPDGVGTYTFLLGGSAPSLDDFVLYSSGGGSEMRLVSGGGGSAGFGFYLNLLPNAAFGGPRPTTNLVLKIDPSGRVGIGTASPAAMLDLRPICFCNNQSGGIELGANNSSTFDTKIFLRSDGNGFARLAFDAPGSPEAMCIQGGGNVGIGTSFAQTTLDIRPIAFANNQSGGIQLACTDDHYRSGMYLRTDANGFPYLSFDGPSFVNAMSIIGSGYVGIGTYVPQSALDVRGTTTTCVLTITGGCDLAEPFQVSTREVQKGSLVVIDEMNPGQVKLSERAYDNRVAGIVSGARGVNSGILLKQQGFSDSGQNVALSGRVYALADASYGTIKPGDLLTTSDTPGHCMKVTDHGRAQGAIIGKAMSALEKGRGMVLVLVSLQ